MTKETDIEKRAREQLAQNREAQAAAVEAADAAQNAQPTPTQEENDLARLGVRPADEKSMSADKSGTYTTRGAKAD